MWTNALKKKEKKKDKVLTCTVWVTDDNDSRKKLLFLLFPMCPIPIICVSVCAQSIYYLYKAQSAA